jgi:Bacterial PH domain
MRFPSKRGIILSTIMWGVALVALALPFIAYVKADDLLGMIVPSVIGVVVAIVVITGELGTYYVIEDTEIHIYGMFIRMGKVPIDNITSIKRSYNPLAAPALTLKRLKITYGKWGEMCLISPKEEKRFLEILKEKNGSIEIDERLR